MADQHDAFMRAFWLKELSTDPARARELLHMVKQHSSHMAKTGVAMVNLWENLQEQMTAVR
jgi:hypothetical protein